MSRFPYVLFLLSIFPVAVRAADPAKSDADAALFKAASSLYEGIKTETLPNGLKVYLKSIPSSPIVTTMVVYKVGACDEDKDSTGLSHYLEHLLFKGTDKLKPGDIDRMTQRNGGKNNAYTNEDLTNYHFDFAADRWMNALEIEADRMRNTRIDSKHEFEQEKGAVISELNGNEDRPWDLEFKAILPLLFGSKAPYGHPVIGEKQHVASATAEIIRRYYDRWYYPNNASLVVVGGFDEKEALDKIRKLFGSIPKGDLPERKPAIAPPERKEIVRKKMASKFEAPRLAFGFNTVTSDAADRYAFDVIGSVLGGGKTSRLYRKLVDGERLATSSSSSHIPGRYPGWFEIDAELLKDDLAKVEGIILAELKKLADDGVTEVELKRVKRSVVAGNIYENESVHSIADSIAKSVTTNDLEHLKNYLPRIAAVTNDEIKKVARKYLVDAKPVVVWSIPQMTKEKSRRFEEPLPEATRGVGFLSSPLRGGIAGGVLRDALRADSPSGSGGISLKDAKTVTLPNGLKLWLLENHRLPIIAVDATVRNVRMREPAHKNGVVTLMGDLLEEGTTTRSNEDLARLIEDAGGVLQMSSAGGDVKVLAPDTELGIDLLFDCLMNPTFPAARFEAKQAELLQQIAEEQKTPQDRASREFLALVYGKHPYGRPSLGTLEHVRKLTRKDCQDFHAALFRPNNTMIAIVGDFDSAKIVELIKKKTVDWKAAELPPLAKYDVPMPEKFMQKIFTDPDSAQTHVYLGHPGIKRDNPDYYKLLVMDNVLGTGPGFTDRLSANLRDRQGLAYTVNAQIASSATDQVGTFTGYIGTFPDKFTWVRDGFLKEVRKIRDEPPTAQEVDDARKYLTGSLAFRTIRNDQVAGLLLSLDKYGLGLNYFEDYRKGVEAVTPQDVQAVAKKYLDPEHLILVAVGAIDADGKSIHSKK
jgi:zinc protease